MDKNSFSKNILSIVCSVFDAYSTVLFLPGEGESFRLEAAFSLGDKIHDDPQIYAGNGLVGWILRNKKPLLVTKLEQHQGGLGYYREDEETNIKSFMGCPIPCGGALCVDSKKHQYAFTDKDSKILQLFAELVSQQYSEKNELPSSSTEDNFLLKLKELYDLRHNNTRWPKYLQNFLQILSEATGFDYCAFATLADNDDTYSVDCESSHLLLNGPPLLLPLSQGIAGWVFRNGQPVVAEGSDGAPSAVLFGKLPDVPDFRAVMCHPVIVNKKTQGILCLAHLSPRPIDEQIRIFVSQAVDILSIVLENLYLKTKLRAVMQQNQTGASLSAYQ